MNRTEYAAGLTLAGLVPLLMGGCPLLPRSTVVEFANDAVAPVRVTLVYHDQQEIPEDVIDELGREVEIDVDPGEVRVISRSCDDLQAVLVRAELRLLGDIGPEESAGVYRDGDDFGCGDTLRFTFTDDDLGTDLQIAFDVR